MAAQTFEHGRFQTLILYLTNDSDRERYESIVQSAKVDGSGRYKIVDEEGHWTKEGDRVVALKFIEYDDPEEKPDRY